MCPGNVGDDLNRAGGMESMILGDQLDVGGLGAQGDLCF